MFFEKTPILLKSDFLKFAFKRHSRLAVAARPYHAISLRKSGRVFISANGKSFISEAGTITFVPLGVAYETEILEEGEMSFVHFVTAEPMGDEPLLVHPKNAARFKELFREGLSARDELVSRSVCYSLLSELKNELTPKSIRPPKRMLRTKEYLDEHFSEPSLKISDLAQVAGVSEVYFRSEFKKYYLSSPREYVKNKRIELAKDLLSTGICSVSEVATSSGFDSISYFSQEFHRLVGMTPTQYMKE
ncbi:MAG: helix-turn-helix transcriptional regulator [Clostridia bacterium]|nr:helix-turn-helix transcriptional regulator [Clostridia bacterium]